MLAEQATPSQPVHFASQSCPQDAMSGFGQTANRQAVDDSQSSALDAARGFGYSSNQQFPQQGSQQAYQHQYPAPQYPQQYSNASSNQFPQQSQFISSSVPSYSSASQHGMPDPYNIGAYQHAYQQNSQSAQPASYHAQQHLQPTTSLHATPAQYMNGTYAQTPVQFAAHSQPSALSSQLSTASSVSSVAPSTASFAHTAIPQQQTGTSVFGSDYITGSGDILYIRERPVKPQKEDGLVKSPAANSGFHDAFKLDWESHNVIVKDLPSKEAKCSVRKRTMGLHTWGIYKDGGADRGNLLGQVRKSNSKQADITLEKTPQNSYTAQGNLADMTYTIKTGNQIAAQVSRNDMARRATGSRHSYALQVMPGNDCMLMMAITVCIEGLNKPSFGASREDESP